MGIRWTAKQQEIAKALKANGMHQALVAKKLEVSLSTVNKVAMALKHEGKPTGDKVAPAAEPATQEETIDQAMHNLEVAVVKKQQQQQLLQAQQQPQSSQPPTRTQELATMMTSITQMSQKLAKIERDARVKAEEAKDAAISEKYTALAAQVGEITHKVEAAQQNVTPGSSKDPIEVYKEIRGIIESEQAKVPTPPAPPAAPTASTKEDVMLELKKLEVDQEQWVKQQAQILDEAQREYEFAKMKQDAEVEFRRAERADKKAKSEIIITIIQTCISSLSKGEGIQAMISKLGKRLGARGETAGTPPVNLGIKVSISSFPCRSCGAMIKVPAGAETVTCGKCKSICEIPKKP